MNKCESVYGCKEMSTKEIDENYYCLNHYYDYLRDAEKYTGKSLIKETYIDNLS
jgi:hypothetical protein